MTDILNWLQSGSEVASAAISLGATTAAWRAAKHSEKSVQAAERMLRIEEDRRRDEMDPRKNGIVLDLVPSTVDGTYAFFIKVDVSYCIIALNVLRDYPPFTKTYLATYPTPGETIVIKLGDIEYNSPYKIIATFRKIVDRFPCRWEFVIYEK
jgi:hypothetical protein